MVPRPLGGRRGAARADLPPAPAILDAGCGTGGNLAEIRADRESPPASSPRPRRSASAASAAWRVEQAGLESLPFEEAASTSIAATDVVEHVAAEQQALRELRRVTVPGGAMLLTVPAYMWLWSEEDESTSTTSVATRSAGWCGRCGRRMEAGLRHLLQLLAAAADRCRKKLPRQSASRDLDRTPAALTGRSRCRCASRRG